MENKPWCIVVLAILILVFTFWTIPASWWIIWISATLILIRAILFLIGGNCYKPQVKKVKKK